MKFRPCIWMRAACLTAALTMTIQLMAQDNASNTGHQPRYRLVEIGHLRGSKQSSLRRTAVASSLEQQRSGCWYRVYGDRRSLLPQLLGRLLRRSRVSLAKRCAEGLRCTPWRHR